jgi:hypothetical protein
MLLMAGAFSTSREQLSQPKNTTWSLRRQFLACHGGAWLDTFNYWNNLGAKSAKARRHDSHSCAVSGDSK